MYAVRRSAKLGKLDIAMNFQPDRKKDNEPNESSPAPEAGGKADRVIVHPTRQRKDRDDEKRTIRLSELRNGILSTPTVEIRDTEERPANPFAKEQEALLTPWDKLTERILGAGEKAYRKTRNYLQPLKFKEDPDRAKRNLDEYEKLVREGKAKYMGENSGVSYLDYRTMKESYQKKDFGNYYFRSVGIYDQKGKFTGKVRIYRINK